VNYATRGGWGRLAASFAFFVCSLMSKQTLVTLPFVFLLLDYWPLNRWNLGRAKQVSQEPAGKPERAKSERLKQKPVDARDESVRLASPGRLLLEKLPFLAATFVFSMIAFVAQSESRAVAESAVLPLGIRAMNAVLSYAAYLGKTFLPVNLAVFYPHPGDQISGIAVAAAALLLLAISAAAIVWIRRFPYLFVGWFWFLGTLVPMIGIVQVGAQGMADRFTYFPLIGLFVTAAWLIPELVPAGARRARALPVVAIGVLVLLGGASFVQASYWHDNVAVFEHALDCGQECSIAHSLLGRELLKKGKIDEGRAHLEIAVRLDPPEFQSHYRMALDLQMLGRPDEAVPHYEAALASNDWDAASHNNLGIILRRRHDYEAARRHFLRAIEIDVDHASSYGNLGSVCLDLGDYAGAISYSQQALSLDPKIVACHRNLALALRAVGRLDEAISEFQYVFAAAPNESARQELEQTLALKRGQSTGRR